MNLKCKNTNYIRISCPSNENPEKKNSKNLEKKIKLKKKLKKIFSGFSLLGQETLDMGVFIYPMGSPDCEDLKKYMWEGYFRST